MCPPTTLRRAVVLPVTEAETAARVLEMPEWLCTDIYIYININIFFAYKIKRGLYCYHFKRARLVF